MRAAAQRTALILVAIVAVLWLAHGLRALGLTEDARREAQTAGSPDRAELRRLVGLSQRAGRFNADPTPELDRAGVLLRAGQLRAGSDVLEEVVAANPANLRAWTLLARASARTDPGRAREAAAELRRLLGRVGARSQRLTVRDARGRLLPVVSDWVLGVIEQTEVAGPRVRVIGWAASTTTGGPAASVLVFVDGRLTQSAVPTEPRPDVAEAYGLPPGRYGFRLSLPRAVVRGDADVELFAVRAALATQIPDRL